VKFYNNETDSALVFWQIEYIYADGTILQVAGMSNVSSYNSTYGALCFNVTDTANETVHIEAWVAWYNATDEVLLYPGNQTVDMKADLKDYSEIHESQLIVGSNAQEDMLRTRWVQLPFVLDKE
jgi:Mlc titration factor MtfA (ptsG expression regulator)